MSNEFVVKKGLILNNQAPVKFTDASGTIYVAVQAPSAVSSGNVNITLPGSYGTSGQILATNSSGTLSWVTPASITSGSVTSGFIGDAAVVSGSVGSGQIGAVHLASGTIPSGFALSSGSVISGYIGDAAVVSGSIASGQIGANHIASGVIPTSFSLTSGIVQSGNIADNAVNSGNVSSGSIGLVHLASGTVFSGTFVASGTVQSGSLGNASVVSGSIASGSIGSIHLASGVVVGFLTSGIITSGMIGAGAVFNNNIASGVLVPTYISGTANQILGINAGATANEYKTLAAGTGITITNNPNLITIGTGGNVPLGYYISAYSNVTQTNTGLASGNLMTYNNVAEANGISVRSGSNVVFGYPGTYNIQFSAQLDKTDAGTDQIDIWLKLNGSNVADSSTRLDLAGNNAKVVAAWNWVLSVSSGDYTEIAWYSADADLRLYAEALISGHIHPAIPSVIMTAVQVMNTSAYGTVTNVDLSLPNQFVVSGNPVVSSGTLSAAWAYQPQNTFLAAPANTSGTPSFRVISSGDIISGQVMSGSISSGQIGSIHLASGVVVGFLTSGIITSGMIGNNAVVSGSIASGSVAGPHLASGVINAVSGNVAITSGSLSVDTIFATSGNVGVGTSLTLRGADGVTSGAGGSIILQPGVQATTGGHGQVIIKSNNNENLILTRLDAPSRQLKFTTTTPIKIDTGSSDDLMIQYVIFKPISAIIQAPNTSHYLQLGSAFGIIKLHDITTGVGTAASIAYHSATQTINTSQNNYPINGGAFQRLNVTSGSTITGLSFPSGGVHVDGRFIRLANVGTQNLTLSNQDALSSGNNRFYNYTSGNIVLGPNRFVDAVYDSTTGGWRVYGDNYPYVLPTTNGTSGQLLTTNGVNNLAWANGFALTSGSITSGFIGDNAVNSGNISSGQIFTLHIASGGLLSGAIGSGQIGQFHLASGVGGGGGASLTSGSVTSGFIGNAAVVSGSIGSGQISYPHIAVASGFVAGQMLAISYSGTLYFSNIDGGTF